MDEIEDLINRLTHMSFHDKSEQPGTAILIMTQHEIGVILNALAALKATSQVVSSTVSSS